MSENGHYVFLMANIMSSGIFFCLTSILYYVQNNIVINFYNYTKNFKHN